MANSSNFTINIKAIADMKDVISNIDNIQTALKSLKLPDNLNKSFDKTFGNLSKEIEKYQKIQAEGFKTKGNVNAFSKSGNNILRLYDELVEKINSIDNATLKNAFKDLGTEEVARLKAELNELQTSLKSNISSKNFAEGFKTALNDLRVKFKETNKDVSDLATKLSRSTFNTFTKNLTDGRLDLATNNLKSIRQQVEALGEAAPKELTDWVTDLETAFSQLTSDSSLQNLLTQLDQIKSKLSNEEANVINELINKFQNFSSAVSESNTQLNKFVSTEQDGASSTQMFNSELDQVKNRIKYFLGLNNAINLVKRAIRSAVDTIKDLDKAMTETAVVTDFTVSDMWKQLPEYTKRANQLGVTTQAAYEAATLFYQQGLNTQQAAELSTETLKMARIAGLDAAEATDRMTNALRGFNMELNAQSAQRVDDVYSQLAAHTASNVDEISTAMTKVASLAHNANMEFETTAAFLSQIIETTRESAETAGTALKTVVARFSEVKKLYGEDQLRGTDEEGQVIDVNRIGVALRSAGIDLNKYFLGEVGLDDIFMELASKWDTLSSVQQRYIATQAAGSRQQSRFIALMQNYARTQELVSLAYDANGASAEQFAKTQESLESKLNRLKNAWNEFLMGLTNNEVVKTAVDLLTNLLNMINNLTSAFGDGAGSILKWLTALAAFSTIKKIFGATTLGKTLVKAGILGSGGTIMTGLQSFGQTIASGLGLGTLGKTAAAITGISTALLAVGAAASAAYLGYQLWLENTPEGHIKLAEKDVKVSKEQVKAKQQVADAYKDLETQYKEYTVAINTTVSLSEQNDLIKERNDAILKAIEENPDIAQYVNQDFTLEGELVLTLNEEQVTEAAIDAAAAATKTAMDSYFAEAKLAAAQAEAIPDTIREVESTPANNYLGATIRLGEEHANTEANLIQKQNHKKSQEQLTALAYSTGLAWFSDLELNKTFGTAFTKNLSSVLAHITIETTKQFNLAEIGDLANAFKDGKLSADVIKGLAADNFEFSVEDLVIDTAKDVDSWNLDSLYQALGITTDNIQELAVETGIEATTLKKILGLRALEIKQLQINNKKQLKSRYQTVGLATPDLTSWAPKRVEIAESVATQASTNLSYEGYKLVLDKLSLTQTEEDIVELQNLINQLNVDDPITSFGVLKKVIQDTKSPLRGLAEDLLSTERNLSDTSQLVQSFLISDDYTNILEDIEKIIDTNGSLGATDINDLAKSSSKLNTLLKNGVINAQGLANALTLVAKGKLSFDQLTNSVISALEHIETFDSLVRDVHNFIADFDEGIDYGESIDFLIDKTDELKGLLDNWEFGNQRSKNLYEMLFGTNYMDDWAKGDDYIKKRVTKMQNWLKNDGYNFFKDLSGSLGIKDKGKGKIDWDLSQFNDIEDLYTQVAKKAKISNDAAKMFIENFASHGDYKFNKQLSELSQKGAINSIVDKYAKGKTLWRESDLQAIADSLGISLDKLKSKIQKAIDKAGLDGSAFEAPKTFKNGDLLKEFQQNLKLSDQNFSSFISDFVNNRQLDETHLRAALSSMGYAGDEMNALIQEIKDNLKETDQIDDVETNPEVTVDPEVIVAESFADKVQEAIYGVEVPPIEKPLTVLLTPHPVAADIDLNNRPKVSANAMANAGWDIGNNDYATLFSQDYASSTGKSILFTPIFTDENGNVNVLTPKALEQYAGEVLEGIHDDNLNLGIKTFDENTTPEQIKQYADELHEAQAEIYKDTSLVPDIDVSAIDTDQLENLITITPKVEDIEADDVDVEPIEIETELNTDDIDPKAEAAAQTLYDKIYSGEVTAAEDGSVVVTTQLDEGVDASQVESLLAAKLAAGANDSGPSIRSAVTTAVEGGYYHITVHADVEGLPTGAGALGGLVKSFAEGSADHFLQPGFALTGEEGPEIVWNKEKGYAYITGRNGAEFQNLQPGDRVFNAAETSRILRNSSFAKGGIFQSFVNGTGRWKIDDDSGKKSGGGGSGSGKDDEDNEWKNEIDWLYNLVQNLEQLERRQTSLQEEYNDLLKDSNATGKDLYKSLIKQVANLQVRLDQQTLELQKREQQMREFMDTTNDMDEYLRYNWKDRTLEVDADAIKKISDEDTKKHLDDLISEAEDIQSQIKNAEDAIDDINEELKDLENIWRDTFRDFEDRVLKAIVQSYQDVIDEYSELNTTLNDSNSAILDAINKEISLQRQIRDNTKTEEEIANNEAQLAYLRRDTTGGNDLAALQLQKELEDQREQYQDNLIDQAISRLQDDNDAAAQQREKQIEIMQAQLDYQNENGEFNEYMRDLIESAISPDGTLATDSDLYNLLTNEENYKAMTDTQREVWEEELRGTFNEVVAYLLKQNGETEGTYFTAVSEAFNGLSDIYTKYIGTQSQNVTYGSSSGGSGGRGGGGGNNSKSNTKGNDKPIAVPNDTIELALGPSVDHGAGEDNIAPSRGREKNISGVSADITGSNQKKTKTTTATIKIAQHAKGGLNTTTGLAWLDGTLSEPEYVLSARQTEAFLKLADVLPAAMAGTGTITNTTFGATTNNIVINVDKIDSDYSVDQMVDRVKEKLFESGSYRNVNSLSFLR